MAGMRTFLLKRLGATIVLIWLIATVVFFLARLSPYDPIRAALGNPQNFSAGGEATLRHEFGLDVPIYQQYLDYMGGLAHGNLGYSEAQDTFGQPVWSLMKNGVPVSIRLGLYALLLALLIGLPVGMVSALRQNSAIDYGSQTAVMIATAVPIFVTVPLAQLFLGAELKLLPVSGWGDPGIEGWKEMILPVGLYAAGLAGFFAKSFRSFVLEVMKQDYVRTARAKGLRWQRVVMLHVLKNTLLPLASIVGPTVAYLVVGAFIIESFFSIPGIGSITVTAVQNSNYPVIQATTILIAASVMVVNLLTDIFYTFVDPRVRL
jgi:ABC-type dipeptide/oligopeptide/nickel transport system permease component